MKRIFVGIFLFFGINGFCQTEIKLVLKLDTDVLWTGINNLVGIEGNNSNKNIFLRSNDADISKTGDGFNVIVKNNTGNIAIDVYEIVSKDTMLLFSKSFFCKKVPIPVFSIGGVLVDKTISRTSLLKNKRFDVFQGDRFWDKQELFSLTSFDMEIDGNIFHSDSNALTIPMINALTETKSNSIRILNDKVFGFDATRTLYRDKTFVLVE